METHIKQGLNESSTARLHNSRRSFYRVKGKHYRKIDGNSLDPVRVHKSVKQRWDADSEYRPPNLKRYIDENGWPAKLEN